MFKKLIWEVATLDCKICFGIPSWLPDTEPARTLRKERVNRLFKQLNDLWPNIDILVIAQNWGDFKPIRTLNKQIIKNYKPLGILLARKTLRKEFLKLDYDYIIMFDDDAIIKCDNDHAHLDFIKEIEKHKDGFCFIHGNNSPYHPYIAAQLNLCAISRFIYENEPMVDVDPQKDQGFEDSIYACLLHHKWGKYEFDPPKTIRPTQFLNTKEVAPSTWAGTGHSWNQMTSATNRIQRYIIERLDMPKDVQKFIDSPEQEKKTNYTAGGGFDLFGL